YINQKAHMKANVLKQVMRGTGIFTLALGSICLDTGTLMANPTGSLEKSPEETGIRSQLVEQDVIITGTVVDASGQPIPGVTVSVPGTTVGTSTDLDGKYSINVPEGATLVFSFIGFESQSIPIGDRSVID